MLIARFWIIAICVTWAGIVGYHEIVVRGDLLDIRGSALRSGAKSCSGSFSSRYECRSSRLTNGENAIFVSWGKGIGLVTLPPLTLLYLFGKYVRRREDKEAESKRQAFLKRKRDQGASGLEPST